VTFFPPPLQAPVLCLIGASLNYRTTATKHWPGLVHWLGPLLVQLFLSAGHLAGQATGKTPGAPDCLSCPGLLHGQQSEQREVGLNDTQHT